MNDVQTWLLKSLTSARPDDEEEQGKVTVRLSLSMLGKLDSIATQTGHSRTKAATGLLESAIQQAMNTLAWKEQDPGAFAEYLEQFEEDEHRAWIEEQIESGQYSVVRQEASN